MLTFAGLLASQIKRISKSLSVEVSRFVERFFGPGLDYSKQAYYKDGQYRSWQEYLLLAGDSSTLQLPLSRELAAALGAVENKEVLYWWRRPSRSSTGSSRARATGTATDQPRGGLGAGKGQAGRPAVGDPAYGNRLREAED